MAVICPCVTPTDIQQYNEQMKRIEPFAKRMHLDFMDGHLARTTSPALTEARWPEGVKVDLHLMYRSPVLQLKEIVELRPHLVIVHAEAEGNFINFAKVMHKFGIKVGVAVLPKTTISTIKPALKYIDHILIFSGNLGHFGGFADTSLLAKVQEARELKPGLEIGWDGGVNDSNVTLLAAGGVDVLNVGGYIQRSDQPAAAYAKLEAMVKKG